MRSAGGGTWTTGCAGKRMGGASLTVFDRSRFQAPGAGWEACQRGPAPAYLPSDWPNALASDSLACVIGRVGSAVRSHRCNASLYPEFSSTTIDALIPGDHQAAIW